MIIHCLYKCVFRCQEIEEDLKENASDSAANFSLPKEHLESWAWGNDPNVGDLKILSKLISHKQLAFFKHFVDTEGATKLFKTNLYVFARFLLLFLYIFVLKVHIYN